MELTKTEKAVYSLLAKGLSDKAISEALFTSRRTAERHVGNIYKKLRMPDTASKRTWAALKYRGMV